MIELVLWLVVLMAIPSAALFLLLVSAKLIMIVCKCNAHHIIKF